MVQRWQRFENKQCHRISWSWVSAGSVSQHYREAKGGEVNLSYAGVLRFARQQTLQLWSLGTPSHYIVLLVSTTFCQLAQHLLSDIQRDYGPNQIDCFSFNNAPVPKQPRPRSHATSAMLSDERRLTEEKRLISRTSERCILFYSWNVSDICPWFVIIFLTSTTKVHFVLNYITRWTVHIQYDNLCNVIYHYISSLFTTTWYESVIYCSMSFVCLLTGLITYWRKKKDLRIALYVV